MNLANVQQTDTIITATGRARFNRGLRTTHHNNFIVLPRASQLHARTITKHGFLLGRLVRVRPPTASVRPPSAEHSHPLNRSVHTFNKTVDSFSIAAAEAEEERQRQEEAEQNTPAPAAPPEPQNNTNSDSNVYYENCTAAREAGAAPVHRGEPGYGTHLDRDGDGIGCE